jgi:hypothetical protein
MFWKKATYIFITDVNENVLLVQQTCLMCHRIYVVCFFYVLMACNSSGKGLFFDGMYCSNHWCRRQTWNKIP